MTKEKKNLDNEQEADYNPDEEIISEDESEGGNLKKLREKLKKCVAEKGEYLDGWQRTKADFINFKKSEEKRREELSKFAKEDLVQSLLPVLDSFSMALSSGEGDGLKEVYNQLMGILKKEGVEEINPKNDDFNPEKHEAVEIVDGPEGKVVEVLQRGYSLNGKIIRPARVRVGNSS